MDFRIDAVLPATAAQLWGIFFDVQRVATLIPGCEDVTEVERLRRFSAVMKQKIGPFKLEVPARIEIESHVPQQQVVLVATGADKFTGTTINVHLKVDLAQQQAGDGPVCRLDVEAAVQVAGRLASLGYPIVKKRSEELFAEFERRLRALLSGFDGAAARPPAQAPVVAGSAPVPTTPMADPIRQSSPSRPGTVAADGSGAPSRPAARPPSPGAHPVARRVELVLLWPRVGISLTAGVVVAHAAVAFGQSPWWWLAAPLLGVAAGLGQRGD